ncbi:MAG: CmcJ/NvfI family oxidoreductase [Pseudomonadota bacterium]
MRTAIKKSESVQALLTFGIDIGKPIFYDMGDPKTPEDRETNATSEQRQVFIHDERGNESKFTLETNGFEFLKSAANLGDLSDEHLRKFYYPAMESLVVERLRAKKAIVFDHTIRHGDSDTRIAKSLREPAKMVHNDYTERSAPQRIRDFFPDEAEDLLSRRFAIVQVWRPLKTITSDPFAIADAASMDPSDFLPITRRSPGRDGEIFYVKFNAAQRFVYFSDMTPDEALVFKVFDSADDGRARYTAHSAFELPDNSGEPRESMELRLFVFF